MNQLSQTYEFMTADYKGLLADDSLESVEQLEWLLPMATRLVEREALRREISEGQLLQRRHEVEDPAVQHALDILEAGGFIEPVSQNSYDARQGSSLLLLEHPGHSI